MWIAFPCFCLWLQHASPHVLTQGRAYIQDQLSLAMRPRSVLTDMDMRTLSHPTAVGNGEGAANRGFAINLYASS